MHNLIEAESKPSAAKDKNINVLTRYEECVCEREKESVAQTDIKYMQN